MSEHMTHTEFMRTIYKMRAEMAAGLVIQWALSEPGTIDDSLGPPPGSSSNTSEQGEQ